MPSPIAHLTAAYAVYNLARQYEAAPGLRSLGPVPGLLIVTSVVSMLPDIDAVAGLLAGDMRSFHNNATHSLVVGFVVALAVAAVMHWFKRGGLLFWFLVVLTCYSLHVVMDSATLSRGVMAFWPLSDERFLTPFPVFYGLRWSQGFLSVYHLWTILTESLFAGAIVVLLHRRTRRAKLEGQAKVDA